MSFTPEEVATHNTKESVWIILNDKVYDITKFLGDHPGGANILISVAGKDASEMFEMFHKASVLAKYGPTYVIGDVAK